MKIAMIGQKGIPVHYGGVEKHVHDLVIGLASAGHDVTVYSRRWYTKGWNARYRGVYVQHLPSIHTKHLDAITHTFISTLHAIAKRFDIIHYHGVGPSLLAFLPRVLAPKSKVVVTFHSIDRYHQKWGRISRFFLRLGEFATCAFAHETITVSQSLTQYCRNEFGKETTYIPNGVYVNKKTENIETLKQFGLAPEQYILMVSRLVPHKGAHVLINAFARLKKQNAKNPKMKNLKLVVVGGSVSTDDYVRSLKKQAKQSPDIVFTGFQSDDVLCELYSHARALVHPSFNEGLPLTVLEAMSYGLPVLLSSIPEHLELITDPRMFFAENNVGTLVKKIEEFLALSSEEREQLGEKNKRRVARQYNWDTIVPKTIAVYERVQKKSMLQTATVKI